MSAENGTHRLDAGIVVGALARPRAELLNAIAERTPNSGSVTAISFLAMGGSLALEKLNPATFGERSTLSVLIRLADVHARSARFVTLLDEA